MSDDEDTRWRYDDAEDYVQSEAGYTKVTLYSAAAVAEAYRAGWRACELFGNPEGSNPSG